MKESLFKMTSTMLVKHSSQCKRERDALLLGLLTWCLQSFLIYRNRVYSETITDSSKLG
uniref:Uncharacterized protein n=1 Tax=Anguilla anguilla TaxID=7936 RepID=A0A0E9X3Q3_ANGAN